MLATANVGSLQSKYVADITRSAILRLPAPPEGAGPDMDLMLDAGQDTYPNPEVCARSIEVSKELSKLDLSSWKSLSAPTSCYHAQCVPKKRCTDCRGENGCAIHEFKALVDANALDILQPDITHAGGIGEVKRIAEYAALHGKPIAPHVFRTGVSLAAHLHLLSNLPNTLICEYQQIANGLRDELLVEPIEIVDGNLVVPDQPGLGVRITDEILERYRYVPGTIQRFRIEGGMEEVE